MASAKSKLLAEIQPTIKETAKKVMGAETLMIDSQKLPNISKLINRITSADVVMKSMKGHMAAGKSVLNPWGLKHCLKDWIAKGQKTPNPKMQTQAGSSITFQIKDKTSKIRLPYVNNKAQSPKDFLEQQEFPDKLANRLLKENEFQEKTVTTIPIAKLEEENPALADKLFQLILLAAQGGVRGITSKKETINFTKEELPQLIQYATDITLKDDFLDRAPIHAKAVAANDEEALTFLIKITDVFKPEIAISQCSPGTDHDTVIKEMLKEKPAPEEAAQTQTHDTPDFALLVEGTDIKIVRKRDGKHMMTKKCVDASHVKNAIMKYQRDPSALNAEIINSA